jgi:hypothetical protein
MPISRDETSSFKVQRRPTFDKSVIVYDKELNETFDSHRMHADGCAIRAHGTERVRQ